MGIVWSRFYKRRLIYDESEKETIERYITDLQKTKKEKSATFSSS